MLRTRAFLTRMIMIIFMIEMFITVGAAFAQPDTVTALPDISIPGAGAVAADSLGNLYIADTGNSQIILVTAAGVITRFGNGTSGFTPFTDASKLGDITTQFSAPAGIAVDKNGNVYIADTGNHRIHLVLSDPGTKLISETSRIMTIVGNGVAGFSGDGAVATAASVKSPTGVAVDAAGNIYIADNGNYRIRKTLAVTSKIDKTTGVTTYTSGSISTIAGDGNPKNLTVYGIALSPSGDLYIADAGNNRILKMTAATGLPAAFAGTTVAGSHGDGGLATLAQLYQPSAVATDGNDLYIADTMNNSVRKVSLATGVISTRLGTAAGIPAPEGFKSPISIAVDASGNLYVEDTGNALIQKVYAAVSAITTASPPGGTYRSTQYVTLTSSKASQIFYDLNDGNGYRPYNGIGGTGSFPVSSTTTIKFYSIAPGDNREITNSATYTIDTVAPLTTATINADPVNGVYYSALSSLAVSLTSNEPSVIYYTTTGTAPTTASSKYSAPFTIPVTSTLTATNIQFFAVDSVGNPETVQSKKIQVVALGTTASSPSGFYSKAIDVKLSCNNSTATIYYTTDGTDPTTTSPLYDPLAPITISATTTLKYRAKDANGNLEQTKSQLYTIDLIAPTTTAAPLGKSFSVAEKVTLTADDPTATIYYTTTGIAPTTTATTKFTGSGSLTISKTTILMYFAVDSAGNKEAIKTQVYTFEVVTPVTTATPAGGIYASSQTISLANNVSGAVIYYTTDGTIPVKAGKTTTLYSASTPLVLSATTFLQYFSVDTNGVAEAVKAQQYIIDSIIPATSALCNTTTNKIDLRTTDASDASPQIKYSLNGEEWTDYSMPFDIPAGQDSIVNFYAVDKAGNIEPTKSSKCTFEAAPPDTVAALPNVFIAGTGAVANDLSSGTLYIADTKKNQVVMVSTTGDISTFGNGMPGFVPFSDNSKIGDSGVQFYAPAGIAVDKNGNVYIADTGNHRIHLILADPATKLISRTSRIMTIAGNGVAGSSGDGLPATTANLKSPTGVAVDATGNIYIADNGNNRVRKALAVTSKTDKGVTTYTPGIISTIASDATIKNLTAYGVALSAAGDLYIADTGNNRILKMTAASGLPVTVAGTGTAGFSGDGGLATLAQLNQPSAVATYGNDLYIADTMNNSIRKVSFATGVGVISTRLGFESSAAVIAPAGFKTPVSLTTDVSGNLYVEDTGNGVIQKVYKSISAITTAKPPGGTYSTTQSVELATYISAAKIYYDTDDGIGYRLYMGPIPIASTTTIKFYSIDAADNREVTNSATYTIDRDAPVTTAPINAAPVNGVYYSALASLAVSLTSNEPSVIYYTTTGAAPTAASTKYSAPFTIPVTPALMTTNVKFFAVDSAGNTENIQSNQFQVIALSTTASSPGGFYSKAIDVKLSCNNSTATIYYTTDGTDPTTISPIYDPLTPITISANATLKYRAKDANGNLEQTKSQLYTIDLVAPTTTAAPLGKSFSVAEKVTLTADDPNATIYYTTTGIAPTTTASTKFAGSGSLTISKTTVLMYFAVDTAGNKEPLKSQVYTLEVVTPITTAAPAGGIYASSQTITLANNVSGAVTYYTTDGTIPSLTGKTTSLYTAAAPLVLSATTILQYFSVDTAGVAEVVKAQQYIIDSIIPVTTAHCDTTTNKIDLKTSDASDSSAQIKYRLNGGKWTDYSVPFDIPQSQNNIVNFYAVDKAGNTEPMQNAQCLSGGVPALKLETLPDNSTTTNGTLYIKGVVAPATTAVTVNGIAQLNNSDGSFSTKITLTPGINLLSVVAGATTVSRTITYNSPPIAAPESPALTVSYPSDNFTGVVGSSILITGTVSAPTTSVMVSTAGGVQPVVITGNRFTALATLDPGINTITITAHTINGTPFSLVRNVTSSTLGPVLHLASPENDQNVTTNPITINGLVTSDLPPVSLVFTQSDGTTGSIIPSDDGTFSQEITLPDGSSWISVTATDANGSSSTVQRNMTLNQPAGSAAVETGAANSISGNTAIVPLTLTSGYQASSLSVDIGYDPNKLTAPGVELSTLASAAGKSVKTSTPYPGIFRILIPGSTKTPIPDGIFAYIKFSTASSAASGDTVLTTIATASDNDANMLNIESRNGAVSVMSKPGDLNGDAKVVISEVQSAINMFLGIKKPVDGAVDLDSSHQVEIHELQKVINNFMGLSY